ncbi:MAG: hypothetical protein FD157_471 [Rhodocyclaceae bacterium]|nr:MAG: hypothetical protein FD157_471 [Rhodocyclaceae bacterium]TNC99027.1 MAG: hypothetical protein FD118_3935 [Rhodocyclaceae bacterium]
MLGFFSSKTVHPLADSREAKRILAEIASREPQSAVEDANAWLESLAADESFKLAQRLELILKLDEATLAQARRLGRDYPVMGGGSRVLESRQWQLGHGYWQQLVSAYLGCLDGYRAAEKENDAIRPQLPLLYGRLIHALAAQFKWKRFRYGPVGPEFWQTLGAIYLAAVDAKAAQKPFSLYAGSPEGTIEAEYLKVLVFHASSLDNLQPLQIEIAERFIAYFLPYFSLIRELLRENVYWVDAAKPLPPTRLAKLPEVTPTLRFFNGTRAMEAVGKTIEQIRSEMRVPPGINLGAQYEVDVVIPVLEHLAMCWAPKPPMRSNVRRRIHSGMKVANGLAGVHQRLSGRSSGTEGLDAWAVDDVSLGGFGAQVPVSRNDWIRIGVLVGMQPEGGENWLIGIVRRYVRTGQSQGSVGIETISKTPRAIFADAGGLQTEALLLDTLEVGEYARMALAANALEDKMALVFDLDDKKARLHPRETLMTGPDFVVANFFVQSFS